MRILGIDPGSRVTGYGIVDSDGNTSKHVDSGCIRTGDGDFPARLHEIFLRVQEIMAMHEPTDVAIERVFVNRNADSALKLGQARAAAICATFARQVSLHEYAARAVKQAVVGRGGADKQQVQHMVRVLLKLHDLPAADEADALAVALCHAHSRPLASNTARVSVGQGVAR
ncbi:MAG: crossover junction endodeoxyribonuclease RuvC [Gammaproteobacteria bacterium]|nr:crossover junction endodeoxyribonuclease RuvC [Gammaproteobacteria bacterium]